MICNVSNFILFFFFFFKEKAQQVQITERGKFSSKVNFLSISHLSPLPFSVCLLKFPYTVQYVMVSKNILLWNIGLEAMIWEIHVRKFYLLTIFFQTLTCKGQN